MESLLDVFTVYNEPYRKYHNLAHINHMLCKAQYHGVDLTPDQKLAVIYHDYVYVPGAKDNEELSAIKAFKVAKSIEGADPALVAAIILDTKDHIPTCEESKVVIDLDLLTLSDSWKDFCANQDAVIAEYELYHHTVLDSPTIKEMAQKFIDKYGTREKLYYTQLRGVNAKEVFVQRNFEELQKFLDNNDDMHALMV